MTAAKSSRLPKNCKRRGKSPAPGGRTETSTAEKVEAFISSLLDDRGRMLNFSSLICLFLLAFKVLGDQVLVYLLVCLSAFTVLPVVQSPTSPYKKQCLNAALCFGLALVAVWLAINSSNQFFQFFEGTFNHLLSAMERGGKAAVIATTNSTVVSSGTEIVFTVAKAVKSCFLGGGEQAMALQTRDEMVNYAECLSQWTQQRTSTVLSRLGSPPLHFQSALKAGLYGGVGSAVW